MISLNCWAQTAKSLSHLDDWLQSCRRPVFLLLKHLGIWQWPLLLKREIKTTSTFHFQLSSCYIFFWGGMFFFVVFLYVEHGVCFWSVATKNVPVSFRGNPAHVVPLSLDFFYHFRWRIVKIWSWYETRIQLIDGWKTMFSFSDALVFDDSDVCGWDQIVFNNCHTLHGVSILHLASYLAQLSTTVYYPTKNFYVSLGFRLQLFTQPFVPARFANGFRHDVGSCSSQCFF